MFDDNFMMFVYIEYTFMSDVVTAMTLPQFKRLFYNKLSIFVYI